MIADPIDEVLSELPKKVRDRLESCPPSGQGVNPWIFKTALSLTSYFEDSQIIELLETYVSCTGRDQEIMKAVCNARRIASGAAPSEPRTLWPAADYKMAHDVVINSPVSLERLRSASPVVIGDQEPTSEEIIDSLFPGNPLLCCAREKNLFRTRPREFWRGRESGMQFIVPNAMTSLQGKTKEGKPAELLASPTFTFARATTYEIMNLYAVKMAAVFMISTSTLAIRTGIIARWIAFLGYTFALFLLLSGRYIEWILMLFPLWVLLVSIYILIDNLLRPPQVAAISPGK